MNITYLLLVRIRASLKNGQMFGIPYEESFLFCFPRSTFAVFSLSRKGALSTVEVGPPCFSGFHFLMCWFSSVF